MRFISISNSTHSVSFQEALRASIPPDGTLYFPERIPSLRPETIAHLAGSSQKKVAKVILSPWVEGEIPSSDLDAIIAEACTFPTPVIDIGGKHILELFHGPTMAFKDVAARYLAALLGYFNRKESVTSTVLVATSGDTGGAIAYGFGNVAKTRVIVLFPKGRVSELQYDQLTRTALNVMSVEVDGTFDDCQALVKQAFADADLSPFRFISANSINVGRIIPQITYYASSYSQMARDNLRFIVPTGNLGSLTAGVFGWAMGLPFKAFLAATNQNDAVPRYIATGDRTPISPRASFSNAMDVGTPSNLPRLARIFKDDYREAQKMISATSINDVETSKTIKNVYEKHGYLLDPHTAVGWAASERLPRNDTTDIIVATASPIKFAKEIEKRTGISINSQAPLATLRSTELRVTQIDNSYQMFKKFLHNALAP